MAVRCYLVIGPTLSVYPALPIRYKPIYVRNERTAINGQYMLSHRATKLEAGMDFPELTEAQFDAIIAAATPGASFAFVNERNVSRTMVVTDAPYDLIRTEPAVEGGTATTGPGYYGLSLTLREV
jgi:hypothetical protein